MANRSELIQFLDRKVFDPILHVHPDKYSEGDRRDLEDVQKRTRTEQEKYHNYLSTEKVREMYLGDLSSENVRPVNNKLKKLKQPIWADVTDEFLRLAG